MDHNVDIEYEGGGKMSRNGSASDERGMNRQPLLSKNRVNTSSQIAIVGSNICPIESLDYE